MTKKTLIIVIVVILILIIVGVSIYFLTKKKDDSSSGSSSSSGSTTGSSTGSTTGSSSGSSSGSNSSGSSSGSNNSNSSSGSNSSSTPSGVSNPPISKWQPVKSRVNNDDNTVWSGKIYDAMTGEPAGNRKAPYETGVVNNGGILGSSNELTKQMADGLCENPCYWYYNHPNTSQTTKDKVNNAALCDCSTNKSKNF